MSIDLEPQLDLEPKPPVPLGVGCLVLVMLLVVIPVAASAAALSFQLTSAAKWTYVLLSVLAASAVTAVSLTGRRFLARFGFALLVLSLPVLLVAVPIAALSALTDGFSVLTTEAAVPSPNHRLMAVHTYIDNGALGGASAVSVRGRLVPGVVEWDWDVSNPDMDWVDDITWADNGHVIVDGHVHAVPLVIQCLSW